MTVAEIALYRLRMPLATPYHVSYRVYDDFEPIVVEARDQGSGRSTTASCASRGSRR